jgi:hypothetical protein
MDSECENYQALMREYWREISQIKPAEFAGKYDDLQARWRKTFGDHYLDCKRCQASGEYQWRKR